MADNRDRTSLASMIYGEARNQSYSGKAAVGWTAMTRAQMAGLPVSDVVYGSISPKYGQYSFANPQDPNASAVAEAPYSDPQGWQDALDMADGILSGQIENPVPGATNYQVTGTGAAWATPEAEVGTVGAHSFYTLPAQEVTSVVQRAAASPYRRQDLVDPEIASAPRDTGVYQGLPSIDGEPNSISAGEFDFTSPAVERGFGQMTPTTQQVASEMARTLPSDQSMTMTATHGQHGLSNLTHTPGSAFDVRTRGLSSDQLDDMVDSALYSRPEAIGYNSGLGKFPAHMHVDTNGGYGAGLQSTSELSGLSDYAQGELARYDAEMQSGLGYTPPVPESIAPVPQASPLSAMAQAPATAPTEVADSGLSGGLSSYVDATASAPQTFDGIPVNTVQTTSFRPQAAALPDPVQAAPVTAAPSPGFTVSAAATTAPTVATAGTAADIYSPQEISDLQSDVADFREEQAVEEGALGTAPTEVQEVAAVEPEAVVQPAAYQPVKPAIAAAPVRAALSQFPSAPAPTPITSSGMDVWNGLASQGIATDGTKLTRNPDGSVSRISPKSGKMEKVGDAVAGWDGPSFGTKDTSQGFWGGLVDSVGDMWGGDIGTMGAKSQQVTAQNGEGGLSSFPSAPTAADGTTATAGTGVGSGQETGGRGGWGQAAAGGLAGLAVGGPVGGLIGGVTGFFGGLGSLFGSGESQAEKASHGTGLY